MEDFDDVDFGGFSMSPLAYPSSPVPQPSRNLAERDSRTSGTENDMDQVHGNVNDSNSAHLEHLPTTQSPAIAPAQAEHSSQVVEDGSWAESDALQQALALSRETLKEDEDRRRELRAKVSEQYRLLGAVGNVQPQMETQRTKQPVLRPDAILETTKSLESHVSIGRTPSRRPSNTYQPNRGPLQSPDSEVHLLPAPASRAIETGKERAMGQTATRVAIRNASRSRSSASNTLDALMLHAAESCETCDTLGLHRSYCNVCEMVYCGPCWEQQAVHRRRGKGPLHEKTDRNVAKKVQDVLRPNMSNEDREQLHTADIDTTWFGVAREEGELPLFRDYGRYATLMSDLKEIRKDIPPTSTTSIEDSDTLLPSLVSFVGQTGAGKSTLIKLLIDLKLKTGDPQFPSPVVGAAGRDLATSEDVHLYLDPDSALSAQSRAPLLFADCEGLEGGERDPFGAILKKRMEKHARPDGTASGSRGLPGLKHISEREIIWADSPKKRSREFAVAHLYPRLLYTFSDVIVFVVRNPRTIEGVLERLVDWAQAALETSSNQPVLPHAIIAFNASEYDIEQELWDVEIATAELMESLSRTVYKNATFKKYAQFWRERDRQVESVEQLILSYYSSIKVVRIPTVGRPNLIQNQVEKLSSRIDESSRLARQRKASLRMLLDADEFQPYLQTAFDHFAENLNLPFDFVQASFSNSPIPQDFGGNILKLAIQVLDCWKDLARGPSVFEELSYVVASCILLDAARNRHKGGPNEIFPMYLEHIDSALENFCDRHWACEYVSANGRCVNVRSGHGAKGHQLKSGKLLAAGDYSSNFSFDAYREEFRANIYLRLTALFRRIEIRAAESISRLKATEDEHRDCVLPVFVEHASRSNPKAFISHTVCFVCLFEPPEHALPCGHIICTPCLKAYGKHMQKKCFVEISYCPMERRENHWGSAWRINLKPPSCGVRILTLDGGGVRGIVELETLKLLEKEIGPGISVPKLFDLIVGTSTGGIIALGLTARNWTVRECAEHFELLCHKAFTCRKGAGLPLIGWLVENYNHSKYETQPLQEALTSAFSEKQLLFGGLREARDAETMDIKVAVTATSAAGTSVVMSNYNRLGPLPPHDKLSYHFQRPEKPQLELKTWEAARATSAAPTYFKPLYHDPTKQSYLDGGIYHNNPIRIADQERKLIWPGETDNEPDIVLSVGSAFCNKDKSNRSSRWPPSTRGIISHGQSLISMGLDHIHSSLDSERAWREYLGVREPSQENRDRYIRLNPELPEHPPKLDEVDKMAQLKNATNYTVGSSQEIRQAALRLVAACFYFEASGDVKVRRGSYPEAYEISGYFNCRCTAQHEVAALGNFLRRNAVANHPPHFLIREKDDFDSVAQEILLDGRVIDRMIKNRIFRISKETTIRQSSHHAITEISLCLTRDACFPISGFPKKLHGSRSVVTPSRHVLAAASSLRWSGRSSKRVHNWTPPESLPAAASKDVIDHYSDAFHLLGSATRAGLGNTTGETFSSVLLGKPELHSESATPAIRVTPTPQRFELDGTSRSPAPATAPAMGSVAMELPTTELQQERLYVARDDWHALGAIYLGLRKGDVVKVTRKLPEGWWLGRLSSSTREGYMPSEWLLPAGPSVRFKDTS